MRHTASDVWYVRAAVDRLGVLADPVGTAGTAEQSRRKERRPATTKGLNQLFATGSQMHQANQARERRDQRVRPPSPDPRRWRDALHRRSRIDQRLCRRALRLLLTALLFGSCTSVVNDGADPMRAAQLDEQAVCTEIRRSNKLQVAPSPPDLQYRRCGTVAGEALWWVTFSGTGRMAARTNAGTVRLIATDRWEELVELASPRGRINAVAFSPDGSQLATLSNEANQVVLWSAHDGALLRQFDLGPPLLVPHRWGQSLSFSADGRYLATSLSRTIDLRSAEITPLATARDPTQLYFVDGGRQVLSYGRYQVTNMMVADEIALTRLDTGERIELYDGSSGVSFAVSSDGRWIAIAGSYRGASTLRLIAPDRAEPVAVGVPLKGADVLAFSPDGRALYGMDGGELAVRDVPSLAPLRRLALGQGVKFRGLSPDGLLVAADARKTTWHDPATGAVVRSLPYALDTMVWSPDGSLVAGSREDALLQVWRATDAKELCHLPKLDGSLPKLRADAHQSADGSITVASEYLYHFGSVNWYQRRVEELPTKRVLRTFAVSTWAASELSPDGSTLITEERLGAPYQARWCR